MGNEYTFLTMKKGRFLENGDVLFNSKFVMQSIHCGLKTSLAKTT